MNTPELQSSLFLPVNSKKMDRHFDLELDKLNRRLLKMGNIVSGQIHDAFQALLTGDISLAQQIIERDREVNRMDVKIDKLCQRIFALSQPVASDLRLIMSALKMNNDLERMGDHAVGIASRVEWVSEYPEIIRELGMDELIRKTELIVRDMMTILTNRNSSFVKDIYDENADIGKMNQEISSRILNEMMKKSEVIVVATHLTIILTMLDRISNYSTNIAESIYFIVEGKMIKHKMPESEEENNDNSMQDG